MNRNVLVLMATCLLLPPAAGRAFAGELNRGCKVASAAVEAASGLVPAKALSAKPVIMPAGPPTDQWVGEAPSRELLEGANALKNTTVTSCGKVAYNSVESRDPSSQLLVAMPILSQDGSSALGLTVSIGKDTMIGMFYHLKRVNGSWKAVGHRMSFIS
jgi:hypothetical protein